LSFKPRFILSDGGRLELVPLPTLTKSDFEEFLADPGRHLRYEYFLPGGPAGAVRYGFPYSWTLIKLLWNEQVQSGLRTVLTGLPWWASYYAPDHPSHSFQVMAAIVKAFWDEARARGRRPMVLMLATPTAVDYYQREGVWVYARFIDHMAAMGVEVVNLGPPFIEELNGRSMCEFAAKPPCDGHFNDEGYATFAKIVFRLLKDRGWVSPAAARDTAQPSRSAVNTRGNGSSLTAQSPTQ
jgi:hypothetical protein